MPRNISPFWALLIGLVIVPLASGFNGWLVFSVMTSMGYPVASPPDFQANCITAFVLCAPFTGVTFSLLQCWNAGHHFMTRVFCGVATIVSLLIWHFCYVWWTRERIVDSNVGAVLFWPLVWTMLFPTFALAGREPQWESIVDADET